MLEKDYKPVEEGATEHKRQQERVSPWNQWHLIKLIMVSEQCSSSPVLLLLLLISHLACNTGQLQRLIYMVLIYHSHTYIHKSLFAVNELNTWFFRHLHSPEKCQQRCFVTGHFTLLIIYNE